MKCKTDNTEITRDSLFDGDLVCYQNRSGYRFSIDSVLLAHFCNNWKNASILDLGCGCGILGLVLTYRNRENISEIVGIEYQESLVKLAEKNIKINKLDNCFKVLHGDYKNIKRFIAAESFTHIICNPPFYQLGSGRPSQQQESYLARHQVAAKPIDIARAISFALKNRGTAALIYPADQAADLISILINFKVQPKVLQPVFSYPEAKEASLILLECRKNGGTGLKIRKPLFIYQGKHGAYSKEVEIMYLRKN